MFDMGNATPVKASLNRDEIVGDVITVECYVGKSDFTWSDGHYVYLRADTPQERIKEDALWCLQWHYNEVLNEETAFMGVYNIDMSGDDN